MAEQGFKAILFDLDGTLLDTYGLILESLRYATREVLGEELPASTLMEKVGQPLVVQMRDFSDDEAAQKELFRQYMEYNASHHDEDIRVFPGVKEALEGLKGAGYPLGVITSKRHNPALQGLRLFGLDAYMDCMVGADDCDLHKPDPGPVLYGADLLGISPHDCLYVGDSPYDIQAGRGAGAKTAAALWGMFPALRLRAEGPTWLCDSITEVPALVRSYAEIA